VSGIGVGLETYKVCAQHAIQDFLSTCGVKKFEHESYHGTDLIRTGKATEDFAAWPRCVNEEPDVDIGNQQTEQLGYEK
jgi:hypothetical protein